FPWETCCWRSVRPCSNRPDTPLSAPGERIPPGLVAHDPEKWEPVFGIMRKSVAGTQVRAPSGVGYEGYGRALGAPQIDRSRSPRRRAAQYDSDPGEPPDPRRQGQAVAQGDRPRPGSDRDHSGGSLA